MTRIGNVAALLLGLTALWVGVSVTQSVGGVPAVLDLVGGGLAFAAALGAFRGRPLQPMYATGAIVVLVAHLPQYFRAPAPWPHLVLIFLGSMALVIEKGESDESLCARPE